MLHHYAGATILVANLVNYNCHPIEVGKKQLKGYTKASGSSTAIKFRVKIHLWNQTTVTCMSLP